MQLEQAQALLAQFCEAHAELQPWLEETQAAAAQLCPDAISCDAFREQQALLQVSAASGRPVPTLGLLGVCCPIALSPPHH